METSEYDFHYEPYCRVPTNSATTQRDSMELNSIGTYSTYSLWSRSSKRTMTTANTDGNPVLSPDDRWYSKKDLFPKGKSRQKPLNSFERKNTRDVHMSFLPVDVSTKSRLPLSTDTARQSPNFPEIFPKNANIRNKRLSRLMIFDDDHQLKFPTRHVITYPNNAWERRYKSITESQILSDFLRDQTYDKKIFFKKRSYQQSSFPSPSNKRRRENVYKDFFL